MTPYYRSSAAPPSPAVDVDRKASAHSGVDGVQHTAHGIGSGNVHIPHRDAQVSDFDSLLSRQLRQESRIRTERRAPGSLLVLLDQVDETSDAGVQKALQLLSGFLL